MFWAMVCLSAAADAVEEPREEDEGLAEGSLRGDCEKMLPILCDADSEPLGLVGRETGCCWAVMMLWRLGLGSWGSWGAGLPNVLTPE
jgi:hypothetical protein